MTNVKPLIKLAIAFFAITVFGTIQAYASKRVAMVIGNGAYKSVSALPNPTNDAEDVAASLRRLNFDVTHLANVDRNSFQDSLAEFSEKADNAEVAIFFFAGHGLEINRENYLIPVDAKLKTDSKVRFEAVSLTDVSAAMEGVKGLKMVLLDACRNNPFIKEMKRKSSTRSIGRGLAAPEPAVGSLVSFAAKEGTVASDGAGRNSPYTRGLLANLETPGLEVNFLFRKIRDSVLEATGGKQEPFTYGSLPGKSIYLKAPVKTASLAPAQQIQQPAQPLVVVPSPINNQAEISFWNSVVGLNSKGLFEAYISKYPNGQFTEIAKYRIAQIDGQKRNLEEKAPVATAKPQEQTKVASLTPTPPPVVEQPKPVVVAKPVTRATIRQIQTQLNRVGCNVGRADGLWGKGSIRGLNKYSRHSGVQFASVKPTHDMLDNLKGQRTRICPAPVVKQAKANPKPKATKKRTVQPQPVATKPTKTKSTKRKSTKKKSTKRRSQPVQQEVIVVEEQPRRSNRRRGRVVEEVVIEEPRRKRRRNPGAVIIQGIVGGVLGNF